MVETKPDKKYADMSYMELLEEARKVGLKNASQYSKRELIFELGGSGDGMAVYDRKLYYNPEDIREAAAKNRQIPGRTIFPEEMREDVEKIIAQNPDAFNDYDLGDTRNRTKFIFKRPKIVGKKEIDINRTTKKKVFKNYGLVKCFCGKEIQMVFTEDDVNTARAVCECGKQVIFIDPDKPMQVVK